MSNCSERSCSCDFKSFNSTERACSAVLRAAAASFARSCRGPNTRPFRNESLLANRRGPPTAPRATPELQARAEAYATRVLDKLDYAGVLALEFFQLGGELLANEMAPRVHNSGHWTIEGAETSQFENHLRAILGLPLGPTAAHGHSAMMNLIGMIPERRDILSVKDARLHLYGKAERPARKVGHVTALGDRLEGASRPGHFRGVATVVAKLFQVIGPSRSYFGEKDAQQLAVIRRLVADLDMPVEVWAPGYPGRRGPAR